jgi:hypothetical protein
MGGPCLVGAGLYRLVAWVEDNRGYQRVLSRCLQFLSIVSFLVGDAQ